MFYGKIKAEIFLKKVLFFIHPILNLFHFYFDEKLSSFDLIFTRKCQKNPSSWSSTFILGTRKNLKTFLQHLGFFFPPLSNLKWYLISSSCFSLPVLFFVFFFNFYLDANTKQVGARYFYSIEFIEIFWLAYNTILRAVIAIV